MNLYQKKPAKTAMLAASALIILLTGCQSAIPKETAGTTSNVVSPRNDQNDSPDTPQKNYIETEDGELSPVEPYWNAADTSSDASAETSTVRKDKDTKASVQTESEDPEWNPDQPMLKGVSIGNDHSAITKRFGVPLDSYKLDEESEPITVLEYDGFAIGINPFQSVQFVEVFGKNISAGLSGLQVGDKPELALRTLGKPEKQTAYLLTYETINALLKLDLDPVHNEIVSIKLLALN
ncbi:hypothetical protein FHS16_003104 [Paenibacillus endophyticus]|uniref:DUF4309 domain-containing protein n=1 Tax=Paenibacillus endophyticus TaxID=1294268 RepID=A0A7W5C953_9BACL|nr:hypothetical protein [Paenibacillus endophyticus]MBB3153045.1 hypothetical protein [Paenibacillus endophyticus]